MGITIFSFLCSVFWSSILIIVIYLLRKTKRFKASFSLGVLVSLYLFSIVRIAFPLELPHSIMLDIKQIYPPIYDFLKTDRVFGEQLHFSLMKVLIFIWIIGVLIQLIRYIFCYRQTMRCIAKYALPCCAREYEALDTVKKETGKSMDISLRTLPNISVPFGVGIFRKSILLPQSSFMDRELHYILLHEYTHFLNRDILVKVMVSAFCCIFWWLPVVYLLKTDLEQTLEMKCDTAVARHLNAQEKAEYLRTIVNVMRQSSSKTPAPRISTSFIHRGYTAEIKERFDTVMHCEIKRNRTVANMTISLIFVCVFIFSYTFIPQPSFDAPASTEPGMMDFDTENAYIRQDKAGSYWICTESHEPIQITYNQAMFCQGTGVTLITE